MSAAFFTLEKFIYPYQIYLYFNCGLIASMYPPCLYLLFFSKVKINHAYKFMLFGCASTTFLNSILYCLWAPILTPEFFGGIVTGILRVGNLHIFTVALIILTNSELCTILLLVFQFSTLRESSFLAKFGKSSKRLLITYFCYLGFMAAVALILTPLSANNPAEFRNFIDGTNNEFSKQIISKNFTLITFSASLNSWSYALGSIEIISSSFLFLLGFYYTMALSREISTTKKVVSSNTYRLELMMFRTFVFKTAMMSIFYVFPMLVYTVSIWLRFQNPLIGMACNIIMVSHGWISYLGTTSLIRPYRNFLLGFVIRSKRLQRVISESPSQISPSNINVGRPFTNIEKSFVSS